MVKKILMFNMFDMTLMRWIIITVLLPRPLSVRYYYKIYCILKKSIFFWLDFKYFWYYVISKSCFPLLEQNSEMKIEEFLNFNFPQLHKLLWFWSTCFQICCWSVSLGGKLVLNKNTAMVDCSEKWKLYKLAKILTLLALVLMI